MFPDWLQEIVAGPKHVAKSYRRYCTRGYAFAIEREGRSKMTYDAGVSSSCSDDVYYGNIKEILEIQYPGVVGLRCTISIVIGMTTLLAVGLKPTHLVLHLCIHEEDFEIMILSFLLPKLIRYVNICTHSSYFHVSKYFNKFITYLIIFSGFLHSLSSGNISRRSLDNCYINLP